MRYDPDEPGLIFDSLDEAMAFHDQLGALLRHATIATSSQTPDAEAATERVRGLLGEVPVITAALNAFRARLPRRPG